MQHMLDTTEVSMTMCRTRHAQHASTQLIVEWHLPKSQHSKRALLASCNPITKELNGHAV